MPVPKTGATKPRQKPRDNRKTRVIVRNRTGCLACKRRRKKCDEQKPICGACIKLKLPCSFDIMLHWHPSNQQCHPFPVKLSVPGAPGYLLNCNYDDMNLYHVLTNREMVSDEERVARLKGIRQIESVLDAPSPIPEDQEDDGVESELFTYYVGVVSQRKAFGNSHYNELKFLVVPNSIVSPALYQSVIALAAHDMKSRKPDKAAYYLRLRGKYKHEAINLLYKILDDEPDFISSQSSSGLDEVVITILMLCSLEISDQGNKNWISHLREGGLIFGSLLSEKVMLSELLLFAYRYFSLRYILLLTTLNRRELDLFMESSPWPLYELYYQSDSVDYILGCSPKLLFLVYETTLLRHDLPSSLKSEVATRYSNLLTKLTTLKQTLDTDDKDFEQLYLCSQAYFTATKLFFSESFDRIVSTYYPMFKLPTIPETHNLQLELLAILENLTARAHTLTLFPTWCLFISAMFLPQEKHRLLILNIFKDLEIRWPLGSPTTIKTAIELIWKMNDLSQVKNDWTEILSVCNYMLALT